MHRCGAALRTRDGGRPGDARTTEWLAASEVARTEGARVILLYSLAFYQQGSTDGGKNFEEPMGRVSARRIGDNPAKHEPHRRSGRVRSSQMSAHAVPNDRSRRRGWPVFRRAVTSIVLPGSYKTPRMSVQNAQPTSRSPPNPSASRHRIHLFFHTPPCPATYTPT